MKHLVTYYMAVGIGLALWGLMFFSACYTRISMAAFSLVHSMLPAMTRSLLGACIGLHSQLSCGRLNLLGVSTLHQAR